MEMYEAFWNGLPDVRWEDAPLGPETTRLVLRLRECGYAEPTCRDYGHAVIHLSESRWHARQDIIQWLEDLSAPRSYVKQNPASHSFKPDSHVGPAQIHIISGFT